MFAVSAEAKNLKTAIISTLANNPGLGAREVFGEISKGHDYDASYQKVHKALRQLKKDSVLDKRRTKYVLSKDWLRDIKEFLFDLEDAYIYQRPTNIMELPNYGSVTIRNNGPIAEPYVWMLKQANKLKEYGKKPLEAVCIQRRSWPLLILTGKNYQTFKKTFNDRKQYALIGENRKIDRYFAELWKESGFKCRLGAEEAKINDSMVCGDFIFQVFHDNKTKKQWDRFYDFLSKSTSQSLIEAHRIAFETTAKSEMVVTRNAEFAEQIREKARAKFGK
ncbi:MAG: hypothetical protein V1717_01775 [Candidatus Micrarchaeota archaeon]